MPRSEDLPEDLQSLARRNALEVSHNRFRADSERLIEVVKWTLKSSRTERQREREEQERIDAEHGAIENAERPDPSRPQKQGLELLEHEPQVPPVGPVAPSTLLDRREPHWAARIMKIVHPKRWKIPGPKRIGRIGLRSLTQAAIAFFLLLTAMLIGLRVLTVKSPTPALSIIPSSSPSQVKPAVSLNNSLKDGVLRQETNVAGVMADLTRFDRAGIFITAASARESLVIGPE